VIRVLEVECVEVECCSLSSCAWLAFGQNLKFVISRVRVFCLSVWCVVVVELELAD